MSSHAYVIVDKVKWFIYGESRTVQPICMKHSLRMYKTRARAGEVWGSVSTLKCEECTDLLKLPRSVDMERLYIIDKVDALTFSKAKFINIDGDSISIAEDKQTDDAHFVKAILTDSKVGKRLVVYVGKRGDKDKSQIFVEPEHKRLSFDQNNIHPSDVFTKFEATFRDGTTHMVEKV